MTRHLLRRTLRTCGLVGAAVVLTASGAALAGGGKARGPLAAPEAAGPWDVGRTTFAVVDAARGNRTLAVDAWYPVDPEDAAGAAPSVYDLIFAGLVSELALDAPPASSQQAFPLVVFSHGNNGIRFQSFFLCEVLASHGFVVVAPDHSGNTALDILFGTSLPISEVAILRPQDVSFLITTMLAKSADPADPLYQRIDPDRIGVAGHSFGGFTALAVASGFAGVPADPRVDAIVPISPASTILTDDELAGIGIPTLILGGTADVVTPIEPQSTRPFQLVPARPRYRVDVREAGHNSFTDICAIADALIGAGLPPDLLELVLGNVEEGCAPDLIPIEEAHRLSDLYAVAFFKRYVSGDPRHKRYLTRGRAVSRDLAVDFFAVNGRRRAR